MTDWILIGILWAIVLVGFWIRCWLKRIWLRLNRLPMRITKKGYYADDDPEP